MEQKPAQLRDVLNYVPEQYLTADELNWIRNTFATGPGLKIIRKVFMPTLSDPELPIEEFGNDLFLAGRSYAQIAGDEIARFVTAREDAIKFIAGAIVKLSVMANSKEETSVQKALRMKQDSGK